MAEIVGAFGMPHAPNYPSLVASEGPQSVIGRQFDELRTQLESVQAESVVFFDSDHLNTFFVNNLPTFSVGIGTHTAGPNDRTEMPRYDAVAIDDSLARYLRRDGVAGDFDLSMAQSFELDHSIMVPLHFLTPQMQLPIVPVFINAFAPPVPSAKRCYALGERIGAALKTWSGDRRVAIVASGSFSLEVGGPRIHPGSLNGVPDPGWLERVCSLLRTGDTDELLNEATHERIAGAGNTSGELLNWIALLGAIGKRLPRQVEPEPSDGGAFAVWRWD